MLKNHFKIAWRNLLRNKTFSFINVFGLSVGLATCFIIMLYVFDEVSYDRHQEDLNQIYRISLETEEGQWAGTPAPLAASMKMDFPEVKAVARILTLMSADKMLLKNGENEKQFYETSGYYADSSFFEIFTYDFKYGDKHAALRGPNTVVISEEIAHKLYGGNDPVDKVLNIEDLYGQSSYTVKGVFKNNGNRSHLKVNYLLSMNNNGIGQWVQSLSSWSFNNIFHTYVKLEEGADAISFERKLPAFLERHGGKDLKEMNVSKSLFLQPLKDIYLKSEIGYEVSANGSIVHIYIFSSIAAFLLLIACINFMNLSTARSEKRAREVGVRKVMGANKHALIRQFLGESIMISSIGFLFSLLLVVLFLPAVNAVAQKELTLLQDPFLILLMIGLTLLTGLMAGLYPSVYLSSFNAVVTLKGKLINSISAIAIRKGLVIFQFAISISLIVVAVVIVRQLDYIRNQDLGFDKHQKIILPFQNSTSAQRYRALKNELLNSSRVVSATSGSSYPGIQLIEDLLFYPEGKTTDDQVDIHFAKVADDYIETLGYELLYGRTLEKSDSADLNAIILNETAVKKLGYKADDAVGKRIFFEFNQQKQSVNIVGVVKDFNYRSLHENITPYGIIKLGGQLPRYFIADLQEGNLNNTIADIRKIWERVNPGIPFEYSFLDQDFQSNYEREERTSRIIMAFTFIAVFIACLGLFGLASFTAEQRKKEVGVRKVLGASIVSVTALLTKDFLKLVLVALVIAGPIAYYLGKRWLQDFAYRIEISWWIYALAGFIAIAIALITIGFQSIKTALSNPSNTLRTE